MKLPRGWKVEVDAEGVTQYSNEVTGTQTKELQPSRELSGGWRECQSDEGHVYYFNDTTGASSWEFPTDLMDVRKAPGDLSFEWVSPRAPLPFPMKTALVEDASESEFRNSVSFISSYLVFLNDYIIRITMICQLVGSLEFLKLEKYFTSPLIKLKRF